MALVKKIKLTFSLVFTVISSITLVLSSFYLYDNIRNTSDNSSVLGVNSVLFAANNSSSGKGNYKLRYQETINGGLVFTGNSLCFAESQSGHGSCGTFTSNQLSLVDPNYSPKTFGTTADWQQNGGRSELNIPEDAEIVYAELIWGGNYSYLDQSIEDQLNTPISLFTPTNKYQVKPDTETAAQIPSSSSYVRSANITEILKNSGAGSYFVSGVPALLVENNPYNNYAGYTIAVAYKSESETAKDVAIFIGAEQVGADQSSNVAEIEGFLTPSQGKVDGKLFISAQEGDSMYKGDKMQFGFDPESLQDLEGPNNKKDNFFASQINDTNGKLDKTGSFGDNNQKPGKPNIPGTRQGWDVTAVSLEGILQNNQTKAYAKGVSSGDSYVINALGTQIEVNSANLEIAINVDAKGNLVCPENIINVELKITNEGLVDSINTTLENLIPEYTILVQNSLSTNPSGISLDPSSILNLKEIKSGQTITVNYQLEIKENKNDSKYLINPKTVFSYVMFEDQEPIQTTNSSKLEIITDPYCGINRPPEIKDDEATAKQGQPETINILDNDFDADGKLDLTTLKITKEPSQGQVVITEKGELIYTADEDSIGKDILVYEICDDQGACGSAAVNINIYQLLPPNAAADQAITTKNQAVTISVLDNDADPDGELVKDTLEIITNPVDGELIITENYQIVYTPKFDFSGQDQFVYKICDNDNLCSQATAIITINDVKTENLPPVVSDDKATTFVNTEILILVLDNDTDPKGQIISDTLEVINETKNGQIKIDNGSIIYEPNENYKGKDSFEYIVCNDTEKCGKAYVEIMVLDNEKEENSTKQTQLQAVDDNAETSQNQKITINVLDNDIFDDFKIINIVRVPKNGTIETDNENNLIYSPNPDFFGQDDFQYEICDNYGKCDKAMVTVTVKPKGRILGDIDTLVRTGGVSILGVLASIGGLIIGFTSFRANKKSQLKL